MVGGTPRRWLFGLVLLVTLSMLPSASAQGGGSVTFETGSIHAPDALPGVYEVPVTVYIQYAQNMCTCTEVHIELFVQEEKWKNRTIFEPSSFTVRYDLLEQSMDPGPHAEEVHLEVDIPAAMAGEENEGVTLDAHASTDGASGMHVAPTEIFLEFPDDLEEGSAEDASGDQDRAEASPIPSVALPGVVLALSLVAPVARGGSR